MTDFEEEQARKRKLKTIIQRSLRATRQPIGSEKEREVQGEKRVVKLQDIDESLGQHPWVRELRVRLLPWYYSQTTHEECWIEQEMRWIGWQLRRRMESANGKVVHFLYKVEQPRGTAWRSLELECESTGAAAKWTLSAAYIKEEVLEG